MDSAGKHEYSFGRCESIDYRWQTWQSASCHTLSESGTNGYDDDFCCHSLLIRPTLQAVSPKNEE